MQEERGEGVKTSADAFKGGEVLLLARPQLPLTLLSLFALPQGVQVYPKASHGRRRELPHQHALSKGAEVS